MNTDKNKKKSILTEQLINQYKEQLRKFYLLVTLSNDIDELTDGMITFLHDVREFEAYLNYPLVYNINYHGDLKLTEDGQILILELLPHFGT